MGEKRQGRTERLRGLPGGEDLGKGFGIKGSRIPLRNERLGDGERGSFPLCYKLETKIL